MERRLEHGSRHVWVAAWHIFLLSWDTVIDKLTKTGGFFHTGQGGSATDTHGSEQWRSRLFHFILFFYFFVTAVLKLYNVYVLKAVRSKWREFRVDVAGKWTFRSHAMGAVHVPDDYSITCRMDSKATQVYGSGWKRGVQWKRFAGPDGYHAETPLCFEDQLLEEAEQCFGRLAAMLSTLSI